MSAPILEIDNGNGLERYTLAEFIEDNPEEADDVRALEVGQVIHFGGGAGPLVIVRRLS